LECGAFPPLWFFTSKSTKAAEKRRTPKEPATLFYKAGFSNFPGPEGNSFGREVQRITLAGHVSQMRPRRLRHDGHQQPFRIAHHGTSFRERSNGLDDRGGTQGGFGPSAARVNASLSSNDRRSKKVRQKKWRDTALESANALARPGWRSQVVGPIDHLLQRLTMLGSC